MKTEVLFEEYREGILECVHHGMVCMADANGHITSIGEPDWMCYYRSCSKPIQALPIIMRGLNEKYGLTEEETAIFSGSHYGDADHVRVLESIIKKTGLKEEQMIMLPTYPGRTEEKERLLRENKPPRKLYHNCSGKHLAMMLLAREIGEPIENYWMRGSKTQEEILKVISMITDFPAKSIRVGVDGCGVPVYAVPFHRIATSYLRLMRPELIREKSLREAVKKNVSFLHSYPNMISGKGNVSTILTADGDFLGKDGAQGVYAMGVSSLGLGIVFKILDGSQAEFASGVVHILRELGCGENIARKIEAKWKDVIINDNKEEVGYRKAVFHCGNNKIEK